MATASDIVAAIHAMGESINAQLGQLGSRLDTVRSGHQGGPARTPSLLERAVGHIGTISRSGKPHEDKPEDDEGMLSDKVAQMSPRGGSAMFGRLKAAFRGTGGGVPSGAANATANMAAPAAGAAVPSGAAGMATPAAGAAVDATAGAAAGAEMSALANPVTAVVGAFVGLAIVSKEAVDKVSEWTHSLHAANMQFAEFSGAMSAVKAKQDVRDIQLSQMHGNARAESVDKLAGSMSRLDFSKAPIEDAFANLKAEILSPLADGVAAILEGVVAIGKALHVLKDSKVVKSNKWFEEASEIANFGRPKRGEK